MKYELVTKKGNVFPRHGHKQTLTKENHFCSLKMQFYKSYLPENKLLVGSYHCNNGNCPMYDLFKKTCI